MEKKYSDHPLLTWYIKINSRQTVDLNVKENYYKETHRKLALWSWGRQTILFFFFFCPCLTTCWILVPQPGIKPMPPTVEMQGLNHWTTRGKSREFLNSKSIKQKGEKMDKVDFRKIKNLFLKRYQWGEFPGGRVVRSPCFHCQGFDLWSGN